MGKGAHQAAPLRGVELREEDEENRQMGCAEGAQSAGERLGDGGREGERGGGEQEVGQK